MKTLLFIIFISTIATATGQGMKIKWEDQDGREFSITAPTGEFSYGMIAGDKIMYDYNEKVTKVGTVHINYDYGGRVIKVGTVHINYDYNGRVTKVGRLHVNYDYSGRITGTSGSIH